VTTTTPTLVYDGDCGFCTASARWIERRLRPAVRVVPWQELDDLAAVGLTVDDVTRAAWWIDADGHRHEGHLAIGEALAAARTPRWRLVGRVILVPPFRWLGGPVYRLVARYRYRLPGATDACRVDTPR
jgi:predicted DCC family thiol-disulfide oxidoreductase YuxK